METWNSYVILGSYVFLGIALLIILVHEARIWLTVRPKDRYDYVNQHEIKYFWYAIIAFIAGVSMYLSAILTPLIQVDEGMKMMVSLFFLAGFVVISYLVLSSMIRILYPRFLESRLRRIRNKPRISSIGNKMRRLSFDEGAVHLEESQLAEHVSEIHSAQYEVWIDEETGEKLVEKYLVSEHADKCSECGFYTMKIASEEILKKPSQLEPGILLEHNQCTYCNHKEAKEVIISSLGSNLVAATS
jgi:hypothetical protein